MKALKIDPWLCSVTCVDLNLKPPTKRWGTLSQKDAGLRRALDLDTDYEVQPLPHADGHRLILHPHKSTFIAGPCFHFQHDPARKFGGPAFILGSDGHGFHTECRLAPLEVRSLIGFTR